MTLALNPEVLAAAYEYLRVTEPFRRWNLPDSEDIKFHVIRNIALRGFYRRDRYNRHSISISSNCIGFSESLIEAMAHEMIHLHENMTGLETNAIHGAAWHKFADIVCKIHGFDRKLF
jgi:hypothetical protein